MLELPSRKSSSKSPNLLSKVQQSIVKMNNGTVSSIMRGSVRLRNDLVAVPERLPET